MASGICHQCGGPLAVGKSTCPWCGTPVPRPPPAPSTPSSDDTDLEENGLSADDERRADLVGGSVLLGFAVLWLAVGGVVGSGCGWAGGCGGGSAGLLILGVLFLVGALACFVGWIRTPFHRHDF